MSILNQQYILFNRTQGVVWHKEPVTITQASAIVAKCNSNIEFTVIPVTQLNLREIRNSIAMEY